MENQMISKFNLTLLLGLAGTIAAGASAWSQSATSQSAASQPVAPRFSIAKTGNGFVRVDGKTGNLSFCAEKEGRLTCRMAADERTAYQIELEAMDSKILALAARLEILEVEVKQAKLAQRKSIVPGDEELDQALEFADKAMRKLFGMVQELKRDLESDKTPDKTQDKTPDKT